MGLKILLADDMEIFHRTFGKYLEKHGEVTCVSTGKAAMRELLTKKYDIIFCDHHMPLMDGSSNQVAGRYVYSEMVRKQQRGQLRTLTKPILFCHFSSDPIPSDYNDLWRYHGKDLWFTWEDKSSSEGLSMVDRVVEKYHALMKELP